MKGSYYGVSNPRFDIYDARVSVVAPLWRAKRVCRAHQLRYLIRNPGLSAPTADGRRIRYIGSDRP